MGCPGDKHSADGQKRLETGGARMGFDKKSVQFLSAVAVDTLLFSSMMLLDRGQKWQD